ncbi:unnamed protein product [Arabidopsis halleri]
MLLIDDIKEKKDEINSLKQEIDHYSDQELMMPRMMFLAHERLSAAQQELYCLEDKAKRFLADIGASNEDDWRVLLPYVGDVPPPLPVVSAAVCPPAAVPPVPVPVPVPFRWTKAILNAYREAKMLLEKEGELTVDLMCKQLETKFSGLARVHIEKRIASDNRGSVEEVSARNSVLDATMAPQLTEICDPSLCQLVTFPDSKDSLGKVAQLIYTKSNSGSGILALGSNGVLRLWKWMRTEQNPTGKATASVTPQHWEPASGVLMTNCVPVNPVGTIPCVALSKNNYYVVSASGGMVSLFNILTFKRMETFMPPPPASTFLAYDPAENNVLAIGMQDSSIVIYNLRIGEVKAKLEGHQKHITGLAFSTVLNILVSAGADAQLVFWNTDTWEKKKTSAIQLPPGKEPEGDTRVQFHKDLVHLLVSHETQLAIYYALDMECILKWEPRGGLSSSISSACYIGNELVCASFIDGNIAIFDGASLNLRCRIAPSAYMREVIGEVIPEVIAAHPTESNQLAIGLSDGSIKVMELIQQSPISC